MQAWPTMDHRQQPCSARPVGRIVRHDLIAVAVGIPRARPPGLPSRDASASMRRRPTARCGRRSFVRWGARGVARLRCSRPMVGLRRIRAYLVPSSLFHRRSRSSADPRSSARPPAPCAIATISHAAWPWAPTAHPRIRRRSLFFLRRCALPFLRVCLGVRKRVFLSNGPLWGTHSGETLRSCTRSAHSGAPAQGTRRYLELVAAEPLSSRPGPPVAARLRRAGGARQCALAHAATRRAEGPRTCARRAHTGGLPHEARLEGGGAAASAPCRWGGVV